MAGNRFVFSGLDDLKAELRSLPSDLAAEASSIVIAAAEGAAATVRAVYKQHEARHWVRKMTWTFGDLARSVLVTKPGAGSYGVAMVVKTTSPLAWLFDNGSQTRQYVTVNGKPHPTGRMWSKQPPTHIFAGTMARGRRAMYGELRDLLVRHGLRVTGEP